MVLTLTLSTIFTDGQSNPTVIASDKIWFMFPLLCVVTWLLLSCKVIGASDHLLAWQALMIGLPSSIFEVADWPS